MFSEDGAFEMPYLESLGFPWRYECRRSVGDFFEFVRDLYPDLDFHDLKIVCETPEVVAGEYEFTRESSKMGERFISFLSDGLPQKTVRSNYSANRSILLNWPLPSIPTASPTNRCPSNSRVFESKALTFWHKALTLSSHHRCERVNGKRIWGLLSPTS